jgi:DNA ligase-1
MTPLADMVAASRRVAAAPGRNAKVAALAACLRSLAPEEIAIGVAWLSGETPQGRTGIGYALLRDASPATPAAVPSLTLAEVDAALTRIAATVGAGSQAERQRLLAALLERATAAESDFLFRLLLGELRQGALQALMLEAIAVAAARPVAEVRAAAMVADDLAGVARAALGGDAAGLRRFALTPMRPVAPMLAQSASDVGQALRAFGAASFEWKLDGARVQVHKADGEVRVFTRNRNEVTASVPEIVEMVRAIPARVLIVDGEAIALRHDGAPQPFQVTMRRFGRRLDVPALQAALPLSVFFFDCLMCGTESLTSAPAAERFAALAATLPPGLVVRRIVTDDEAVAEAISDAALSRGHDGVMATSLAAPYEAGRRGASWLKIKRAHTLERVVLAAEWGHGRRKGWLSNLHLGARDEATGGFVMLGKTFKGMTDEMLAWQTGALLAREIRRDDRTVHVRPELVVEVAFGDLQASPHYPGGLALRFARVRRYRDDKTAADADSIAVVRAIYDGQAARARGGSP